MAIYFRGSGENLGELEIILGEQAHRFWDLGSLAKK